MNCLHNPDLLKQISMLCVSFKLQQIYLYNWAISGTDMFCCLVSTGSFFSHFLYLIFVTNITIFQKWEYILHLNNMNISVPVSGRLITHRKSINAIQDI